MSVIVERKSFHDKPGLADSWSVVGVIGGNHNRGETESTLIREDDGIWQYLYGGFDIEFAVPCREGDRVSMEDEPHSFLRHWSNCKQMSREGELDSSGQEQGRDQVAADVDSEEAAENPLTDADMPPLDTLGEDNDFSSFLSPEVSKVLRK